MINMQGQDHDQYSLFKIFTIWAVVAVPMPIAKPMIVMNELNL